MNTSDAYDVLQLSPNAHPVMVTRAFRLLAAMYHPDNENTGDRDKFERIVEAYRMLSDPVRRAAYDQERSRPGPGSEDVSSGTADRGRAKPDSERRLRLLILTALYNTRRNSLVKPGVSLWVLAELTDSSVDDVQFSLWYLRGKKLIESDGDDGVAITVAGVDYVEAQEGLMAELLSLPERGEARRPDELST